MWIVGLTGGIGSGKSRAASFFEELGIEIIDADQIAHALTAPHQPLTEKILKHFGNEIAWIPHTLDRKKLRQIVFNHPKEREWLEKTSHPLIFQTMQLRIQSIQSPYGIIVVPLLWNTPFQKLTQRLLGIVASPEIRIQRVQQRDQCDPILITQIMQHQTPDNFLKTHCDDILENNGSELELKTKVSELHTFYLTISCK